jgi:hypothetical protein
MNMHMITMIMTDDYRPLENWDRLSAGAAER